MLRILFYPFIVIDPKIHDLSYKGQLTKKCVFAIFLTFARKSTQLQVTFVQTVEKLKIGPPSCIIPLLLLVPLSSPMS
jgi:hypothetical protein